MKKMKKAMLIILSVILVSMLSIPALAARKLTVDEKSMLAELQGKDLFGRKVSASDIASLENFLMSTDEPLTKAGVDTIMANVDEVISIIITSGVTDITKLPKDAIDKIMKIANSAASVADLSVSVSSSATGLPSVTITDKVGTPVVIVKEEIIKKTGASADVGLTKSVSIALIFSSIIFSLVASSRITKGGAKITSHGA